MYKRSHMIATASAAALFASSFGIVDAIAHSKSQAKHYKKSAYTYGKLKATGDDANNMNSTASVKRGSHPISAPQKQVQPNSNPNIQTRPPITRFY